MVKNFFRYVIPSMLAFAFSGLYAIVDGFFIGRNIGDVGLAAISIAFPIAALIQAIGTGIGMGGAIHISICYGKNEPKQQNRYFGQTLSLVAVTVIIVTALLFLLAKSALLLLGAQGDVLNAALEYIYIIILGTVFQLSATAFTPLLRNYNGAILAMMAMIAGFITNIVLDALFVSVWKYGMAGAAWATIIGQMVTMVPALLFLWKKTRGLRKSDYQFTKDIVFTILKTGVSPFGLAVSPYIVVMLINKSAVIYGGETAVAAYAVVAYVISVILLLLQGIGDGSQPLMSQFLGVGDINSAIKIRNFSYLFSVFVSFFTMVMILLLRHQIPGFFGASQQASLIVSTALCIFVVGFIPIGFCRTTTSYFYATKKNLFAAILVYGEPILIALLVFLLPMTCLNLNGVWISYPIVQFLLVILAAFLLRKDK